MRYVLCDVLAENVIFAVIHQSQWLKKTDQTDYSSGTSKAELVKMDIAFLAKHCIKPSEPMIPQWTFQLHSVKGLSYILIYLFELFIRAI